MSDSAVESEPPIDAIKQKWAFTGPKLIGGAVAMLLMGAAYTQLAPKAYVDETAKATDLKLAALADAQTKTDEQMRVLVESNAKTDKRMKVVMRLVSAQYIDHVDAEESTPRRRRKKPRSSKAKRMAAALQIDPDDPLAGLEFIEGGRD